MSRINKWYSDSKNTLEDEIWPKLNSDSRKVKIKSEQTQFPELTQSTFLDQNEYPNLGENAGKNRKSKEVKQYYDCINVTQKTRPKKIKSNDPITLNLQHIINKSANCLNSKSKKITKRIIISENSKKCKRKFKISKVKLPSSLKHAILWEKKIKRQLLTKETIEVKMDKLKIEAECKLQENIVKNFSTLNLFGENYRQTHSIPISDDTIEFRSDLIKGLEEMKIGLKTITKTENNLTDSFNRIRISEITLNEDDFNNCLSLKHEDTDANEIVYSRKFREYCTNLVSSGLTLSLKNFLTEIKRMQKKLYERDEIKGRSRRRLYAGFKEVKKYILVNKIKFVIIATDIDKIIHNGILDQTVENFIETCKKHDVAICYGLSRHKLGYFVHGKGIVSVIGVANYSGAEERFETVLKELIEARNEYNKRSGKSDKLIDLNKIETVNGFLIYDRINSLLKVASSIT